MTMQVLVIIQVQKHLVFTVPITAALVYFVGGFYLKTSRQLRVLEIEAKAALFNFFAETVCIPVGGLCCGCTMKQFCSHCYVTD